MNILFFMLPVMALIGICLVGAFFWAVKTEQFEDLESQKYRIFFDD